MNWYALTSKGREVPLLPGRIITLEEGEEIVTEYNDSPLMTYQLAIVYTPAHGRLVGKDVCSVRIHLA